jgi:peptidoglycan/LPS O-acetylase OafA/YrhL
MHTTSSVIYFSGLNGLRAIAALFVLIAHITQALDHFGLDKFYFGKDITGKPATSLLAGFGVSIFFSLSGFLITYLLLTEHKLQPINIRNFYLRRILRIWPLYYLYLILVVMTLCIFHLPFESINLFFYIFLSANVPFIIGGIIRFLSHYWSLGVEEQFYAFWPWMIKKIPSDKILAWTVLLCILFFIIKLIFYYMGLQVAFYAMFITRFDCMLVGCIGAILFFQRQKYYLRFSCNVFTQLVCWLIIVFVVLNNRFALIVDHQIISVVTVFIIASQIEKKNRIINLENNYFDFLGKISYGIYVIHPLSIFYLEKIANKYNLNEYFNYFTIYFLIIGITVFTAFISYEFFEKRFLMLKTKYTIIRSSGAKSF